MIISPQEPKQAKDLELSDDEPESDDDQRAEANNYRNPGVVNVPSGATHQGESGATWKRKINNYRRSATCCKLIFYLALVIPACAITIIALGASAERDAGGYVTYLDDKVPAIGSELAQVCTKFSLKRRGFDIGDALGDVTSAVGGAGATAVAAATSVGQQATSAVVSVANVAASGAESVAGEVTSFASSIVNKLGSICSDFIDNKVDAANEAISSAVSLLPRVIVVKATLQWCFVEAGQGVVLTPNGTIDVAKSTNYTQCFGTWEDAMYYLQNTSHNVGEALAQIGIGSTFITWLFDSVDYASIEPSPQLQAVCKHIVPYVIILTSPLLLLPFLPSSLVKWGPGSPITRLRWQQRTYLCGALLGFLVTFLLFIFAAVVTGTNGILGVVRDETTSWGLDVGVGPSLLGKLLGIFGVYLFADFWIVAMWWMASRETREEELRVAVAEAQKPPPPYK